MIIYKVTNIINGDCYIGKTTWSLKKRMKDHRNSKDKNNYFHNALKLYGMDNFEWKIIYECDDFLMLNVMETMKIIVEHSHVSEGRGYNMTWGGEGVPKGYKYNLTNEQHKEKSEKVSGSKNPFYGKKHTKETLELLRKLNNGKTQSLESNKKRSDTLTGRNVSQKTRKKMSETATKLYDSDYGVILRKKIAQPGDKNAMYKFKWIVLNVKTGDIVEVKNKTEWCNDNNINLGMAKYHSQTGKEYQGFIIKREPAD